MRSRRWLIVASWPADGPWHTSVPMCNSFQAPNTVGLFPHWCNGCVGQVCTTPPPFPGIVSHRSRGVMRCVRRYPAAWAAMPGLRNAAMVSRITGLICAHRATPRLASTSRARCHRVPGRQGEGRHTAPRGRQQARWARAWSRRLLDKVYHRGVCPSYSKVTPQNHVPFASESAARAEGYRLTGKVSVCRGSIRRIDISRSKGLM